MHTALTSAALILLLLVSVTAMERSGGFVKLSNGIWWPAMLEQTKGEHNSEEMNALNPFHVISSASDVIVAHLLGEDQVAALKVTDKGVSWDLAHQINTSINQNVPSTLQHQYDHAISLLNAQLVAQQSKAADYGVMNSIIAINSQVPSSSSSSSTSGPSTILGKRRIATESPSASAFVLDDSSSSTTDDGNPEGLILVNIPHPGLPESLCPLVHHNHPSHHNHELVLKRSDALPWDDYFMAVAYLSAMRSKDPNTQVGACIVNDDKRIVGIGYNGFPRGCSDDGTIQLTCCLNTLFVTAHEIPSNQPYITPSNPFITTLSDVELPWARKADNEMDTKYPYVCHAEVNAILNKNSAEVRGCTLFVALFPCNDCAKIIIQSGITEVVYLCDKYRDTVSMRASRRMLEMAKVKLRQFVPHTRAIAIDFTSINK